ncbi:MAG: aspartate carbamoyltransferase catalytic subunit [Chloroflexota bacterium]|nr:aspartate carbamoyltransferase catalytic subunit [Chloroflexota bacterium]MDE2841526.1 aspartate carbamoyltransferase catalytic subunit [Chloroflexota bacterium]MDE2930595.1 aspartate carbamoyltransferase catalytic subunit [Chloroflexota bacterium]
MPLARKDLLDLDDFSSEEITLLLETTAAMTEILSRPIRRVPTLRGKTIVNMFYEASTRTRSSFELAAKNLSADLVNVSASQSSVEKGESLIDTMRTLQALGADMIVMRHWEAGAPYLAASWLHASVINAGDGWHAHPSQALLDLFTVQERLGTIEGLKLVIVGDIVHSRVARSNLWGFGKMGADIVLCGPPTLLTPDVLGMVESLPSVTISYDLDEAICDADLVMMLRLQRERMASGLLPSMREYAARFGLTKERMRRARPNALIMHPGPMNQGVEITPELAYSEQAVIEDQVTNGVAVRMAIFYLLAGTSERIA